MFKNPCEDCPVYAMCIGKSLNELIECELIYEYLNVEDIHQRHSHMWMTKLTFKRTHNSSMTETLDNMMKDLENIMSFKNRRR